MKPERCWSVILTLGLFMALAPLSAQAGANRPFAPQPHRQAFTSPQPRGQVGAGNRQPHQWQQSRGQAHGWNGQNRQGQQPRGNAYGWNGQQHQGQQPQRQAYGWNGQHRQGQQQHGKAYGWNGHQRPGEQQRNVYGRNGSQHQWQQPPNGGQHNNPGSPYGRAGYPGHPQSPNIAPKASGYPHNTAIPGGQTGAQPGSRHPDASGNIHLPQGQSPSGVI